MRVCWPVAVRSIWAHSCGQLRLPEVWVWQWEAGARAEPVGSLPLDHFIGAKVKPKRRKVSPTISIRVRVSPMIFVLLRAAWYAVSQIIRAMHQHHSKLRQLLVLQHVVKQMIEALVLCLFPQASCLASSHSSPQTCLIPLQFSSDCAFSAASHSYSLILNHVFAPSSQIHALVHLASAAAYLNTATEWRCPSVQELRSFQFSCERCLCWHQDTAHSFHCATCSKPPFRVCMLCGDPVATSKCVRCHRIMCIECAATDESLSHCEVKFA